MAWCTLDKGLGSTMDSLVEIPAQERVRRRTNKAGGARCRASVKFLQ